MDDKMNSQIEKIEEEEDDDTLPQAGLMIKKVESEIVQVKDSQNKL